jgi:hypothetical protein
MVAVKNIEAAAQLDIEQKQAAVDNAEKMASAPVTATAPGAKPTAPKPAPPKGK